VDIKQQIQQLETEARRLEPSPSTRANWDRQVHAYAHDFIDSIRERPSFAPESAPHTIEHFSIDEHPKDLESILNVLDRAVDSPGINPASGGHLGYIPGGGIYASALGDYLADVTNRYAGIFFANPGAVRIENQLIRWMCSLVGYPESALGNLASGGSIANLIAITTARDSHGVVGEKVEKAVIYLTRQVHHCVQKALRIAGLGTSVIRYIPMDDRFRMDADALRRQVDRDLSEGLYPFLVVGSAGTTDTGSIDPLDAIADISEEHGIWFHVDAAYGGFFILLDDVKDDFKGVERSDSLAIDPHKGLFLPYGLGAVLIKDVAAQHRSHYYKANYMQDTADATEEPSPADLSPELTKHFRGLRMWLALQLHGIGPFRACLDEKRKLAQYFHREVQKLGFEAGPDPELSVLIYRYVPDEGDANAFNQALIRYIHQDGRIFVSSTTIDGVFWIRLAVLSFRTHLQEIDLYLDILKAGIAQLSVTT
jgi:aromatic-L-amino-acid decarboxylase